MNIQGYQDFVKVLTESGFSMGGGNNEGVFSIISWNWNEAPPYDTPVRWHTEDKETDPWEWRIRVLEEREDISYAKLFFKKSGYITKEWYPFFLAARQDGKSFEEAYFDGTISHTAKRIYELFSKNKVLPLHEIKTQGGFSKEEKAAFDRALTELQMKMYLTMCGSRQKVSQKGEEYGWSSTVFCTPENFFGKDVCEQASKITKKEAIRQIEEQIYHLNPKAEPKKIVKFITG